jgi:hypothetical protein
VDALLANEAQGSVSTEEKEIMMKVQWRKWGHMRNNSIYKIKTKLDTNVSAFIIHRCCAKYSDLS